VSAGQSALSDAEKYIDTKAAAAMLCMSESALRKWRVQGIGPPFKKIGAKSVRYRVGDIRNWIETTQHHDAGNQPTK
jgi:predicted DNA-binding transcriptional regulator AlpA